MVRFEKFEIWHAQGSDADLADVKMTTCAWRHAMTSRTWRHAMTSRAWHHAMIQATISLLPLVVKQLLGRAYLWNRLVDFVHILQANFYGRVHLTIKKSAPSDKYLSCERILRFPWQRVGILKFRFRELFSVTLPYVPAKFGARRSINGRGDSGQTESVTLLKL